MQMVAGGFFPLFSQCSGPSQFRLYVDTPHGIPVAMPTYRDFRVSSNLAGADACQEEMTKKRESKS